MYFNTALLASVSALASVVTASPAPPVSFQRPHLVARQSNATNTTSSPCAQVSSLIYAGTAPNPTPIVPAKVAYECIQSVPINATAAVQLIDSLTPYIWWQSTIAYLKNPPAEYAAKVQPAIDVWGALGFLKQAVQSGQISKEYDFGWALYSIFQQTHDGHFAYIPDSVGGIFNWGRTVPLVSVSEDGKTAPVAYAYEDVLGQYYKNISYTPSRVTQIDGQDACEFLENWAQYGSLQDRDALYNNVFYELAGVALGSSGSGAGTFTGAGRGRYVYPGPNTTLTFANGTSRTIDNTARVLKNFRNVTTGEELAKAYFFYYIPDAANSNAGQQGAPVTPASQTKAQSKSKMIAHSQSKGQFVPRNVAKDGSGLAQRQATSSAASTATSAAPSASSTSYAAPLGFPSPIVKLSNNYIGGYYITDDSAYNDIAVLSVQSFVNTATAQLTFQGVTRQFLKQAKADGKKKLIIDVSANGGGTILAGYDMFTQLFPDILPYSANRFRAHEAVDLIGQKISEISAGEPRSEYAGLNYTILDAVSSYFNYRSDANEAYTPPGFSSWQEKYGPHTAPIGDNFTTLHRWNLSDPLTPVNSGGINVTGYNNLANYTTRPFQNTEIVVVTDGYCASTCTLFADFMRHQANVKIVALGGRSNTNAIQAIGGVKGTNNFAFSIIQGYAQQVISFATPDEIAKYNTSELSQYNSYIPFNRAYSGASPGVNVRDGIRKGDTEEIPLQFVYEEADCRIFYTADMTIDIQESWKAVADSVWGPGESKCVAGSASYGNSKRTPSSERRREVLKKALRKEKRKLALGGEKDWESRMESFKVWTDLTDSDLDGDAIMYP